MKPLIAARLQIPDSRFQILTSRVQTFLHAKSDPESPCPALAKSRLTLHIELLQLTPLQGQT
jgi:hypothetical protein